MAKKDYSVMSHAERKARAVELNPLNVKGLYAGLEEKISVLNYTTDEEGRIHQVVEVKTRKVSDRNKGLNYLDFSIGNLQAIGAVDKLKFSQLGGDIDSVTDSIDKALDHLDSIDTVISEGDSVSTEGTVSE